MSSGYVPERKNWEEHDASVFKLIRCNWKKLCGVNASNVQILLVFRKFCPKKLERFQKFLYQNICHVLINKCANFCGIVLRFTTSKVQKTPIFGLFWPIFGGKIDFSRFEPRKVCLIISGPYLIDSTVKNRPRKPCLMVLAFRAENPHKAPYYYCDPTFTMPLSHFF